ncbi:MAG: radical SAM protein [Bacillota bacterium]
MDNEMILQLNFSGDCRNNCGFCTKTNDPSQNMSVEEAKNNIEYFLSAGIIKRLILSGGEIYDDNRFYDLLKCLSNYKLKEKVIITSGKGLSKSLIELVNSFFDRIVLSITPDSENYINEEEFKEKIIFMHRLTKPEIQTNTVIHGQNLNYVDTTVYKLKDMDIVFPTLTLVFPIGKVNSQSGYLTSKKNIVPVIERLAVEFADSGKPPVIKGVPACYISPEIRQYVGHSEKEGKYYVTKKRQLKNSISFAENLPFIKHTSCTECRLYSKCDGFWDIYIKEGYFSVPSPIMNDMQYRG